MAKCEPTTVERQITVKSKGYTLELTEKEAVTLYFIMRNIGGDTENSPRKYADNIYNALKAADVRSVDLRKGQYGTFIYFEVQKV